MEGSEVTKRKVTKAYVKRCLMKWRDILHLNDWQVQVKYEDEQPLNRPELAMSVHREPPYRWVNVSIYPHIFEVHPDTVDQTSCHEMGHVLLAPIHDEISDLFGVESEAYRRLFYRLEESIDRLAVALWSEVRRR